MILRQAFYFVCVQATLMSVVNGRSASLPGPRLSPHYPSSDHTHRHAQDGTHARGHKEVPACGLCPPFEEITPCKCSCVNGNVTELKCDSDLVSCSRLTDIMSLPSFPTTEYLRLVVDGTTLDCSLERDLWGQLVFHEILMMNNLFNTLDKGALLPFSATLKKINFSSNALQNVFFPSFSDTPLLEELLLDHNKLKFIPGSYYIELPKLRIFKADHNSIIQVNSKTFAGMPSVTFIDLSHNKITELFSGAFAIPEHKGEGLIVNLAHNLITTIKPGVMDGVQMCSLNLQNNGLITLSENIFRPIIDSTAGSSLFITKDNPLECDTKFCWIVVNQTVSNSFVNVSCPNLDDGPLEVLSPLCSNSSSLLSPLPSKMRPKTLPALIPSPLKRRNTRPYTKNRQKPFLPSSSHLTAEKVPHPSALS